MSNRPIKPKLVKPRLNSCACTKPGIKRSSDGTWVCARCAEIEANMWKDFRRVHHNHYLDKYIEVFQIREA
jgi:ribosomal protein L37AE/L43A